ncbi:unnamed protein product [Ilex paraguariensis]|uniref:Uncharacterized protein n=1 Tax=Ilex paraguariensis TaxID=185542 RepID=A0ABC8S0H8_9AQUA
MMGKKLNALLGRKSKTLELKPLANLAISRIAIFKKQSNVRCSHAESNVIQLLNLSHQEQALLRVEHVIKEHNLLDVFAMIENYCYRLIEGLVLLQDTRECPDELKEIISSLIFASSRIGEFPELQQIREIFVSRFGKEFATRAIELRNNCGVNPKMIQKLSTRQASLESRLKVLKQFALDNGITFHLEDDTPVNMQEKHDVNQKQQQLEPIEDAILNDPKVGIVAQDLSESITKDEKYSESMKARMYRDAAAAAQDAFESATYAAAAARAAVELSRIESWNEDSDERPGFHHQGIP